MLTRIGFYICHCGTNIAGKVAVEEVAAFIRTLKNVVVGRDYKFMCSDPGQEMIQKDIRELGLNRVVVASCSPRLHPTMGAAMNWHRPVTNMVSPICRAENPRTRAR